MFNIDIKSDSSKLIAAFLAVYLIWSSTYLAIRFGLESLPPFLMSGSRYLIAGALIYLYAWKNGAGHPSRGQWLRATIIGLLLFVMGNGGIEYGLAIYETWKDYLRMIEFALYLDGHFVYSQH